MKLAHLLFTMVSLSTPLLAQNPDPSFPVTNLPVFSFAEKKGIMYLGGMFSSIGKNYGSHAIYDIGTKSILPIKSIITPPVYATGHPVFNALPDGRGGWYVVGSFTDVDGKSQSGFAHLDSTGAASPWSLGMMVDDDLFDIIAKDSILYIGGYFKFDLMGTRYNFGAVDIRTGALTSFNPDVKGTIYALAIRDSILFIGGEFFEIGGKARTHLGAVNLYTGAVLDWSPQTGIVHDLEIYGNTLYVGGKFALVNGLPRRGAAAFDIPSLALKEWNPALNSTVHVFFMKDSTLYVGGKFDSSGGSVRTAIASFHARTGALLPWNTTIPNGEVLSIAVDSLSVYLAGTFDTVDTQPRKSIACVDRTTGKDIPLGIAPMVNVIDAVSISGGKLFIGGNFSSLNPEERISLAAFDIETKEIQPFSAQFISAQPWHTYPSLPTVRSLAVYENSIFCAGYFSILDEYGDTLRHFVQIDLNTGKPTQFPVRVDNSVASVIRTDSTLYLFGGFSRVNDSLRNGIAAVTLRGEVLPWHPLLRYPEPYDEIKAMAYHNGKIFLCGTFTMIGDSIRNFIGSVDAITGAVSPWYPKIAGLSGYVADVNTFGISGNILYIGGQFAAFDGAPRKNGAAIDLADYSLKPWNPNTNGPLYAVLPTPNRVYIGGGFFYVGNEIHIHLGATDSKSGAPVGWGPRAYHPITTFYTNGTYVFLAGSYHVGNYSTPHYAAIADSVLLMSIPMNVKNIPSFTLDQNYPNPFNPETTIRFAIDMPTHVTVEVFDILGRKIRTLVNETRDEGLHSVQFTGTELSSGVYFYTLTAGNTRIAQKMMLIK